MRSDLQNLLCIWHILFHEYTDHIFLTTDYLKWYQMIFKVIWSFLLKQRNKKLSFQKITALLKYSLGKKITKELANYKVSYSISTHLDLKSTHLVSLTRVDRFSIFPRCQNSKKAFTKQIPQSTKRPPVQLNQFLNSKSCISRRVNLEGSRMQGFNRNYRMRNEFKKAAVAVREIGGSLQEKEQIQGTQARAPACTPLSSSRGKAALVGQRVADIRYEAGLKGGRWWCTTEVNAASKRAPQCW